MMKLYCLFFLSFFSTISIWAQCTDDTHSTNVLDSWESCEESTNPNPARGVSHWILYDLGYVYDLTTTHFWNYNVTGATSKGFKNVQIDYAIDRNNWQEAGQFQLAEATGSSNYQGEAGLDMTGISARYILLTVADTWGSSDCAGLSEFKVGVKPIVLSIEALDLVAAAKMDFIALTWQWSDAPSVVLERSIDAQQFEPIAYFNTKNNLSNYHDTAVKRGQWYYYRLKSVDEMGNEVFSSVQRAKLGDQPLVIKVFPNPVKEVLNIDYGRLAIEEIVIHNASGHEVQRIYPAKMSHRIDVSSLPSGMYYLKFMTKDYQILTERLVKM